MSQKVNGFYDASSPTEPDTLNNGYVAIPKWVNQQNFESIISREIGKRSKIVSFTTEPAENDEGNNSSLVLRVNIKVDLNDNGSSKDISYMLKINHEQSSSSALFDSLMLFPKEQEMYEEIIPTFESLFKDAGRNVSFAPRSLKFDMNPSSEYILLEDVCKTKFRCGNRHTGLDMVEMKAALAKLAQFHAASACFYERNRNYSERFMTSIFTEKNRPILTSLNKSDVFLSHLRKWKNCEQYALKLANSDSYLVDRIIQAAKTNSNEFNVLNHGDLWTNNMMFQYEAFGKIKETYFIDFQNGKYGSPAYDLYYIILTSAKIDIKLSQFDYMVKFYHDNLIENLILLKYHRPLPKLKNLHMSLLKNGLSAYSIVSKILPVVMLDLNHHPKIDRKDNFKVNSIMYSNIHYIKAMEAIMPWLDNRGLLDFS